MNYQSFWSVSLLNKIAKWRYVIAVAIILTILGQAKQVNGAEVNLNNLNPSDINGLFTPTSAERFFEAGNKKFEQEVRILINRRDSAFNGDILKIETEFDESEVPEAIIELDNFVPKTDPN